jgi:hypothetical protein
MSTSTSESIPHGFWQAGSKPSADTHAVVKKRPALVCWSCVATPNPKQSMESSIQMQGTEVQTDTAVQTEKNSEAAAAELVSIHLGELNIQESDKDDDKRGEKGSETDEEEAMDLLESLADEKHMLSSSSSAQEPQQLYPPGKILHMVGLAAAEVATTSQQGAQEEVVALYETPRHLYSKIRLARSMIVMVVWHWSVYLLSFHFGRHPTSPPQEELKELTLVMVSVILTEAVFLPVNIIIWYH